MGKILIAEDERSTRKIIAKAIESIGYTPLHSHSGKHAWETLCNDDDIDLLITDMMMPEMDGRQLIKEVKERKEFNKLPIIIISGIVGIKEISDLLKDGANAFISKPIKVQDIQEYIVRYITPVTK